MFIHGLTLFSNESEEAVPLLMTDDKYLQLRVRALTREAVHLHNLNEQSPRR